MNDWSTDIGAETGIVQGWCADLEPPCVTKVAGRQRAQEVLSFGEGLRCLRGPSGVYRTFRLNRFQYSESAAAAEAGVGVKGLKTSTVVLEQALRIRCPEVLDERAKTSIGSAIRSEALGWGWAAGVRQKAALEMSTK